MPHALETTKAAETGLPVEQRPDWKRYNASQGLRTYLSIPRNRVQTGREIPCPLNPGETVFIVAVHLVFGRAFFRGFAPLVRFGTRGGRAYRGCCLGSWDRRSARASVRSASAM